jgi:hypothetical protein
LNPSSNFHPTAPPIHQTSSSNRPPTAPFQIHHSSTISATIPFPPNPTPLSPSACFSNDHCAGTGSLSLQLHASSSATAEKTGYDAGSLLSMATQSDPSTGSFADMQLYVGLSSYTLQ